MRALLLALCVLGAITVTSLAVPEAAASCTSPTQVGCVCIPTYYGGMGIRGGVVWRCIAQVAGP